MEKNFHYIDVWVHASLHVPWFRVTFVYREPRTENRHRMWDCPRRLRSVSDLPWLVMGDFYEAMWGFVHFSVCERPES